jgi:eukaryotic-like serine/threonine-protein kinase
VADPQAAKIEDPFGLVGTTLDGQYRVDQVVGEGGYGVVYRGWHLSLEQPIAIKALKVLADDRAVQDALFAKFKDEAKLLYTLSQASLNIVRSMDFGATTSPNGLWAPYMVLEWLAGKSLADDLADRRRRGLRGRTLDEAFALLEPAAEGLSIAHHRRVAHRDIKPANFFLLDAVEGESTGRVKVLDFGIAKIVRDNELPGTRSPFASFTWLYAAPEQLDPRVGQTGLATDVYGFALLLTELLTDRVPVQGRDVVTILKAATDVTMRPTPKQRGADVPDAVELVCRRALAVDPKARYANIGELWAALIAARRSSVPHPMISLTPSGGATALPSSGAQTTRQSDPWGGQGPPLSPLVPPGRPQTAASSTGPGVFIPSGAQLGPQSPPVQSPPRAPSQSPPHAPSQSPPQSPPGYPATYPSAGYVPPPFTNVPGSAPMMPHPMQMSPPLMTPPPGQMYPPQMRRRMMPATGSSLPVILAVIGLVVGLMFVATCGAIHAACN